MNFERERVVVALSESLCLTERAGRGRGTEIVLDQKEKTISRFCIPEGSLLPDWLITKYLQFRSQRHPRFLLQSIWTLSIGHFPLDRNQAGLPRSGDDFVYLLNLHDQFAVLYVCWPFALQSRLMIVGDPEFGDLNFRFQTLSSGSPTVGLNCSTLLFRRML